MHDSVVDRVHNLHVRLVLCILPRVRITHGVIVGDTTEKCRLVFHIVSFGFVRNIQTCHHADAVRMAGEQRCIRNRDAGRLIATA